MAMETAFRSEEHFTQQEFRAWLADRPASDVHRYELLRGRIIMSPPAGWRHGGVGSALTALLHRHVRIGTDGYLFDSSTGYELPSGDTVEPDLSFVSQKAWERLPKPLAEGFLPIAPSLVVEILSSSTAKRDRTEKREIYARNGVEEYWLVDTGRREVTIFRLEEESFGPGEVFAAGRIPSRVIPSLEVSVEEIFLGLP